MGVNVNILSDGIAARMTAGLENSIRFSLQPSTYSPPVYVTGAASLYVCAGYVEYCGIVNTNVPIAVDHIHVLRDEVVVADVTFDNTINITPGKHIITLRLPRNSSFSQDFCLQEA